MQFIAEYGLFLTKVMTVVAAILIVVAGIIALSQKGKGGDKKKISIKHLNKKLNDLRQHLQQEILSKAELKKVLKAEKKEKKKAKNMPRLFVIRFHGDIRATAANSLREEITAILSIATKDDEVLVVLESGGGVVHGYGLCASQLARIRQREIPLTIAIDLIAASGGYMMACVANKIIAAPFAIIGSIGVIAQLPNFNRLLKDKKIDFEQHTAGQFKRTITTFGENTDEAREKLKEELEETHVLFKNFIHQYRSIINLEKVATGEHWYARQALDLKLVDELSTSDDYLMGNLDNKAIYEITCKTKKSVLEKMFQQAELAWTHFKF